MCIRDRNSFGAHNLPDFVMIEVSARNVPVSYANAFTTPVTGRSGSLMRHSIDSLNKYAGQLRAAYGLNGRRAYFAVGETEAIDAENVGGLAGLQAWTAERIEEMAHA